MLVYRLLLVTFLALGGAHAQREDAPPAYPEGYYAFQEAPGKVPPKVRKPPYVQSRIPCLGALETPEEAELSLNNLCGDLNDGHLPLNPMGQSVTGHSYPFELVRNLALDFFSRTLPILKEDRTLPRVAKLRTPNVPLSEQFRIIRRPIRSVGGDTRGIDLPKEDEETEPLQDAQASRDGARREEEEEEDEEDMPVEGRAFGMPDPGSFCEDNWGIICLLFNTMSGKTGASSSSSSSGAQDRHDGVGGDLDSALNALGAGAGPGGAQPLTPCPSAVEYVTPVYARNHRGMWRYVVQIPYEGYFTQTVEVTRCLASRCHYVAGGACLATPRWVSLLVAEVYYPDAHLAPSGHRGQPDLSRAAVAAPGNPPPPDAFPYDLQKRQGGTGAAGISSSSVVGSNEPPTTAEHCDGHDEVGCFQVRLYYDWFLVPGSCKCWKQDYFAQFAYKRK